MIIKLLTSKFEKGLLSALRGRWKLNTKRLILIIMLLTCKTNNIPLIKDDKSWNASFIRIHQRSFLSHTTFAEIIHSEIDKGSRGTCSQQSGYAMINTYIYLHCLNKLPTLYYRALQFKSEVAMRKDRWLLFISKWFSFHKHRI